MKASSQAGDHPETGSRRRTPARWEPWGLGLLILSAGTVWWYLSASAHSPSPDITPTSPAASPDEPPYRFEGGAALPSGEGLGALATHALAVAGRCELSTANTPWQILHGIQAFGREFTVHDAATGKKVNAVEYLLDATHYQNEVVPAPILLAVGKELHVRSERLPKRLEDHPGQVLFIMSRAGVPASQAITLPSGKRLSLHELIRAEAARAPDEDELSWLLPSLYHYLYRSQPERERAPQLDPLMKRLVGDGINWEICRGTHSAFALTYLLRQRRFERLPVTGAWSAAERLLQQHVELARRYQNIDGSFAPSWSYGRAPERPLEELVAVSGHMLAWLTLAVPSDELDAPWLTRAALFLSKAIPEAAQHGVPYGALSHGAHGLRLYQEASRMGGGPVR